MQNDLCLFIEIKASRMRNLREGLRWFEQAEADFKTAKDCSGTENYYASAFFSQQAAEKALKGFLYAKGFRGLITHSVLELLEKSSEFEGDFKELTENARELDRHYIGARYPNLYPEGPASKYYTKEDAGRCIGCAGLILQRVKKFLRK